MTIDIPDAIAERIKAEADRNCMTVEDYTLTTLDAVVPTEFAPKFASPEEEAEAEHEWTAKFAASKSLLESLAEEARQERRQDKTLPLDTLKSCFE